MSNKLNIVLFWFMNDWGKYGRAYEQIAKALNNHERINKVICLFPPTRAGGRKFWSETATTPEGIVTITPFFQTINGIRSGYRLRMWLNEVLIPSRMLRWYLRWHRLSERNTIAWIFPPHSFINDVLPEIPHDRLIVQIVDNNTFRELGSRQEYARIQYDELSRKADLVITSSKINYDLFNQNNRNTIFVENGVSPDFFAEPSDFPYKRYGSVPTLGYVGTISERTDLSLLLRIAKERPAMNLQLAGPDNKLLPKSGLLDLPNVKYIGEVPHVEVPKLIKSFDVCLIPHINNPYSQSMSPLKLFQYLASGRPIVSTAVAGTARWKDYIEIATSHEHFLQSIDHVILRDDLQHSRTRIDAVRSETWERRIEEMLAAVP